MRVREQDPAGDAQPSRVQVSFVPAPLLLPSPPTRQPAVQPAPPLRRGRLELTLTQLGRLRSSRGWSKHWLGSDEDRQRRASADANALSLTDWEWLAEAVFNALAEARVVVSRLGCIDGHRFPIDIRGCPGAYLVKAQEFDARGVYSILEEAQGALQRK